MPAYIQRAGAYTYARLERHLFDGAHLLAPFTLHCSTRAWSVYRMMSASSEQIVFAAGALVCAGVASVYDVRERRIPNRLTGPCLAGGLLLHFAVSGWAGVGSSFLAALMAGSIFLVFFLVGGMGAGDVKLMAAVGAITGLIPLELVIVATVIAGAIFALALAIYHGRLRETFGNVTALILHHGRQGLRPHPAMNLANESALRLPFALPIAVGCLAALGATAWSPAR